MEPQPFSERTLALLAPSKILAIGSRLLLVLGPLLLTLAIARVFPPGFFGLHLTVIGGLLFWASSRANAWPTRRSAHVRIDERGIHVDRQLVVPRAKIDA